MTAKSRPRPGLVIVSNRGPYRLYVTKRGLKRERTVGGLVTSVLPMLEHVGGVWIAWGEPEGRFPIPPRRSKFELQHLRLEPEQVRRYYHGLSNSALWPLCHSFLGRVRYTPSDWQCYEQVNGLFAHAALAAAGPDDVIWVHDYQLGRMPQYVRDARPSARLLGFWHIPFPSVELFATFPWRQRLLEGLLACDVLGFHIPAYAGNFIAAAVELLGARADGDQVAWRGWTTRVKARPIGIDFAAIARTAASPPAQKRAQEWRAAIGQHPIVLGVERMDYTKGILERLNAMEVLLERRPDWHGKVTLIQIVTPSRTEVPTYQQKKREVDEAVGRINGRFSDGVWSPIRYFCRSFSIDELIALYRTAEVALVTPLRDGLNLVAKEYVAARLNNDGVLVLSEFAGAAQQLPEAVLVNPYSIDDMATAIEGALTMPIDEQRRRMEAMRARIQAQDIDWWAQEFLNDIQRG
ncbi:MAG: trehalose-6-phosphate synthase [Anaerolineales bacterium]|nr:trehalose-6-phosphate synthase [Anaerolineales bacterium]